MPFGGLYRLSGQKKDFTALHVRDTRALREKQPGRSVCLPKGILRAESFYEGVSLAKENPKEKAAEGMRHMELPCREGAPGVLEAFPVRYFCIRERRLKKKSVYEMV